MPPWVASVPRWTRLLRKSAIGAGLSREHCHNAQFARLQNLRVCSASTYVSPTAIGSRPTIPRQNRELSSALGQLGAKAERYVNLSRLQLALRGLSTENEGMVTRVAVLGMTRRGQAEEVARLLLADPLGGEEHWERALGENAGREKDERAVLLRFGDEDDAHAPNPLFKTLTIPSRILKAHNMEVLVSTLNVGMCDAPTVKAADGPNEAILVPKLYSPSARGVPVPYPVHKAILVGQGLESAVAYGKYTSAGISGGRGAMKDLTKVVIDLPPPARELETNSKVTPSCTQVSIASGTKALATFRESIANSEAYEQGWYRSGLPQLSQWLVDGLQSSPEAPTGTKPIMSTLVSSIADDVETSITAEDVAQLQSHLSPATHAETTTSILSHLSKWAETSHAELRDQLDAAFMSRNWHKLSWWKLFWRVDDVTMICEELLSRHWLVSAEKNCVFLAGCMDQAGYPNTLIPSLTTAPSLEQETEELTTAAVEERLGPLQKVLNTKPIPETDPPITRLDVSTDVLEAVPWPSQLPSSRSALISTTIPPLQSLAQGLVLQTLSTTSLASALSALLYVSMSTFSLFEASAIAALGLVYSLRRMQTLWQEGRQLWEAEVREEGRRTLKKTEDAVRLIVKGQQEPVESSETVRRRREAREAVGRVREILARMGKD
ncbi:hypothetical protein P154DRAFT_557060, partial [Amniculicola lignicola CBS 123094]